MDVESSERCIYSVNAHSTNLFSHLHHHYYYAKIGKWRAKNEKVAEDMSASKGCWCGLKALLRKEF